MNNLSFWKFIALIAGGGFVLTSCGLCPPAGPWPQPPFCGDGAGAPGQTARDDLGCFPPSCDMIPDQRAKVMCQQFKSGTEIWNWPDDCTLMPLNTCVELCDAEWQRHHEVGEQNWDQDIKARAVDWYKEPYTKVYMFGTVNERFEILQPDGQIGAFGLTDKQMQLQVDYAHFYNFPAIAGNASWTGLAVIDEATQHVHNAYREDQIPAQFQSAMGRDLDGNVAKQVLQAGDRATDPNKLPVLMHSYQPDFLAEHVRFIKYAIDFGADGSYFDNLYATPGFGEDANTFYDKFDNYTVTSFGDYLRNRLTESDWKSLGVKADDFNYVSFLKSKGYTVKDFTGGGNDWWSIPLIGEFRRFISQSNVEAFAEITRQAREYALSKGRPFTISGNMTEQYANPLEETADFKGFEQGYITQDKPYQYRSVVPVDKFSKAKDKAFLNYIWAGNYAEIRDILAENPDVYADIYRLSILENYAAKAGEVLLRTDRPGYESEMDSNAVFEANEDTSHLEQIKTAFDFMRANKPYFVDFNETNSKVALLYLNAQIYQDFLDDPFLQHYNDVLELGTALYGRGVDYDVINPEMSLEPYDILFLPSSSHVDDETAEKILDFVKQGGRLMMVNHPKGLLENVKAGPIEKGSIELVTEDAWDAPADAIRATAGSIDSGEVGLHAVSYHDGNGNYVVHLFTPQTDLSQSFKEFRDIPLKLPFDIQGYQLKYATLESPEFFELDDANIVIPVLKTYGLLVIQKP